MYKNKAFETAESICDDKIFAQLTDLFGDTVPTEFILKAGQETKWKLDQCIEKLVKFDPTTIQRPMSVEMENHYSNSDDDADVLIESEEIQHINSTAKLKMASNSAEKGEESEKSNPWPSFRQNVGFGAMNTPIPNQRTGSMQKQPRLMSNVIDKHPDVADIIKHIEQNHRILICMRGAPGSGKSFLARSIIDLTMKSDYDNHIFSTDDFFYDRRSKRYTFDRSKLSQAHDNNQFRVSQRAMNGWSPIIVDNTNMKWWEMFPYFKNAVKNGYVIKILEPNTPWKISVLKLAQRNKHNVDQEAIARMLSNFEPGGVEDILRTLQIYNYPMTPQLRNFPDIQSIPASSESIANVRSNDPLQSRFAPRDQRPRKYEPNRDNFDNRVAGTSDDKFTLKLEPPTEAWPAFEEEQTNFWQTESDNKPKPDKMLPKPQRNPTGSASISNMFSLLQDKSTPKVNRKEEAENAASMLKRHKKECPNENQSFQEIRRIYPQIPVALLWDLFEKCNGDGNWTMDILLNESETKDLQTLNSQEDIDRDNFTCDCDKSSMSQAVDAIPAEWLKDSRAPVQPARSQRRQKQTIPNENDVVKHIEQQFVISDSHYSEHARKIRDTRRSATATTSSTVASGSAAASSSISPDENVNGDDEMIEIDLGIELVCQLDQQFGSKTFKDANLQDIKTKVFMPKSLGQQLYATWIESLYHQIEEQKQQSIKDDEEFAKELQVKPQQAQNLFEVAQANSNIQNIADMEYAWKAYNCKPNDWKQTTQEDLAMKLTKAKLFEIFPNVDKEQLIDVFRAYGNQFGKTVEFFKESLKSEIGDEVQAKSHELINQARVEAQAIHPTPIKSKSNKHKLQEILTLDKMTIEDAKRAALTDFEEYRNLAMHHSHLKAECYSKARDAFQRKQTGVAYYYTTVANLHNAKIDMYNHKAANAIVEVHSYTQQDPNMLDLHYLHADEAIECLDIYLDRHIKELKDAKRGFKYVFIITGRGLHSTGGFSTIKHRVKCRLKGRALSWAEVNPGLLKVKLQYISLFTDSVNNNNN